ncbi:hypothetical protein N566_01845 [Streptomycetaceae bacterium MP113-05]|nr:hypothetical protein N566_01845 [Streptomycetaceae bacterium MP113-05]
MATNETQVDTQIDTKNRHASSEPVEVTPEPEKTETGTEPQKNRHASSEPAD